MSVLCYNKITNEQMFENILRAKEKHTTEKKEREPIRNLDDGTASD